MPATGIEPVRYCYHRILSPARLPVPPRRLPQAFRLDGTYRARTCDPLLVRQVLSQLSYSPGNWWPIGESNPCYRRERAVSWPLDQWAIMVIHPRLERGTPWLKVRCSTDWANGSSYVSDFIEFLRISLAHKDYYISFCILSQHFYYNFLYFFQ